MSRLSPGTRWASGVILAGCLGLAGCGAAAPESGAPDPRSAVDAYVKGLNGNDYQAIARLAPPLNDPSAEIRQRLAAYGGRNITLASLDITSEITPKAAKAELDGRGTNGRYRETLFLAREGDRWHIVLGRNPDVPSDRLTASTTRP